MIPCWGKLPVVPGMSESPYRHASAWDRLMDHRPRHCRSYPLAFAAYVLGVELEREGGF